MWLELTMSGPYRVWVNMELVQYLHENSRGGTKLVLSGHKHTHLYVHEPPWKIIQMAHHQQAVEHMPQDKTILMSVKGYGSAA
jgi:hypothetical protein